MASFTTRYFLSLGNVVFSMFLGALALFACWFYFPETALQLFKMAGSFREWMANRGWSPRYEVAIRAFLGDQQIVFMGFVIATRIVVGAFIGLVAMLFGRRPDPEV
ncbi:MAG: hypothetical protein KDJ41_11045 [Hyphomicrobiaceae bacterium]|nr:hypothetical protein [Hyphomicrobiaceae bacterium]